MGRNDTPPPDTPAADADAGGGGADAGTCPGADDVAF